MQTVKLIIEKDWQEMMTFEQVYERYNKFLYKYSNKYFNVEDSYQEALIALWKAYEHYDSKCCSFGYYAGKVISSSLIKVYKRFHRQKRYAEGILSLDYCSDDSDESNIRFTVNDKFTDDMVTNIDLKNMLNLFTKEERCIIYLTSIGISQAKIAEELNTYQGKVSRSIRKTKKILAEVVS